MTGLIQNRKELFCLDTMYPGDATQPLCARAEIIHFESRLLGLRRQTIKIRKFDETQYGFEFV